MVDVAFPAHRIASPAFPNTELRLAKESLFMGDIHGSRWVPQTDPGNQESVLDKSLLIPLGWHLIGYPRKWLPCG